MFQYFYPAYGLYGTVFLPWRYWTVGQQHVGNETLESWALNPFTVGVA